MARRLPFHRVIARKLSMCPAGIALPGPEGETRRAQLTELLDVLYLSKMPAKEAHKIAKDNAAFLAAFKEAMPDSFAAMTFEIALKDLKGRRDKRRRPSKAAK